MKSNTIVLVLIIALAAFGLGFALNTPTVSDDVSYPALLNARLLETTSADGADTQATSIKDKLTQLTLVNFCATWCAPCRHEMPMFESVFQRSQANNDGFTIVGVTIDSVEKAIPMLNSMGITYPIVYAENTGMELMSVVGNTQGLLPYSLLLDAQGQVLEQKYGQVSEGDIDAWLAKHQ